MAFNKASCLILLLASLAFCALSIIYLIYFEEPWIWIFITASAILITLAFAVKNNCAKILLFNLTAFPIALFVAEVYLYIDAEKERIVKTSSHTPYGYKKKDEILGYAPIANVQREVKLMQGDEVIYDVSYTINADGLRDTPSSDRRSKSCLLFFGGSFTFGVGLNDNETLPYFTGKELDEKYRIFNFGFSGYGPHQMLAALEHGLVENLTKECNQITAIYSALLGHIPRIAGLEPWDEHGPRYILENNTLKYTGHFDDHKSIFSVIFSGNVILALQKSRLFKLWYKVPSSTNNMHKNVFIQIIKRSQYYLRKINKKSKFIVVYWDTRRTNVTDNFIQQNLSKEKLEYYLISDILDGYKSNKLRYTLHQVDGHPNREANKQLAIYLATKIKKAR